MVHTSRFLLLGPLFLLATSIPVSVSVGGVATGLTILAALGVVLVRRHQTSWPSSYVSFPLILLFSVYFLATLFGGGGLHHWAKFGEELWIKVLLLALPIVLNKDKKLAVLCIKLVCLVGVIAGLYAVWQHFAEFDPIRQRSLIRPQWGHASVTGFFSHHLSFGGQVLIFMMLISSWLIIGDWRNSKTLLIPAVAILGAALLWSYGRSPLLGVVAGGTFLLFLARGWRRWLGLSGFVLGLLGAVLVPQVRDHLLMLFEMKRHATRLNLWQSSWEGIKANPLLGYGPGKFEAMLAEHQVPGYYEVTGHAHNDLLMHGVNAGILGIVAALALTVAVCVLMIRALQYESPYRWVFTGTLAVQVGITVAGFFQVYQTDDEVEMLLYFVLGCAVALAQSVVAEPDRENLEKRVV